MLVFVRTPSKFVSLQEDFYLGLGVVGKILQLAFGQFTKDTAILSICPLDHFFYLFPYFVLLKLSPPLRGLGKTSIYNISVKSNVLI